MKKLTMICMSALLMLAVSCKKDKKTEVENAGSGFRATVESHEGTGKTHLEGLAVKWDSGDAILVKSSTCTTPKRFTTTGTDASANFVAAESLDGNFYTPDYTGYYPAGKFSGNQLTLPPTQQYDENNTFASGANPMAATSSDNVLPFKNVCGVLKLQLYSATACQVRSISITSNTGEMLYGTGAVGFDAADDNDNPTLGTLNDGGSTLTLDMGSTGKAMSTSESAPTAYYFVVPVGTLGQSFTVTVTETNGNVWSKTATATQNTIARSQITVLPKQEVETKPDIPEGALPGLFSVSDTKQVYFSKGNLQRVRNGETWDNTCTWKFADHQWETVETENQDVGDNYADASIQTLFGWGDMSGKTSKTNSEYTWTADWGTKIDDKGTWRTLTGDTDGEWFYLLYTRTMKYDKPRYTIKTDGINIDGTTYIGMFIYPDDYNGAKVGTEGTPATWDEIDALGIVFLPAAGIRYGTSVSGVGYFGYYWSSTYDVSDWAYTSYFMETEVYPDNEDQCCAGYSVRLVSNVPNASGDGSLNDFGGGNW